MFLPKTDATISKEREAERQRKVAFQRIERWVLEAILEELRDGLLVEVSEVKCGDPNCSPIDTSIIALYPSGKSGAFGIPAEAADVKKEDVLNQLPPNKVFAAWKKGEDFDWPPLFDDEEEELMQLPPLRFNVGQKVDCRLGPDPVTGWVQGEITELWYRETNWPPDSWAPYKVLLHDGRMIFAPADTDNVVRASFY